MSTTHASLTDRYVAAALKGVPKEMRPDAEEGLRSSIAAAIEERIRQGETADAAEVDALTALGDPMRRAAVYTGRPLYLIGPGLYPDYIRLLRLLLAIVVPVIGVLVIIASAIAGASAVDALLAGLGAAFNVGVQVALWVTVAFAVVERAARRPRDLASSWNATDLPELPSDRIGLGETIASICGLALLAWVLIWQPGYQETFDAGGSSIPVLDPALNSFWIPFLVGVVGVAIVLEIVKYRVGKWTIPLALANTVVSLAFVVPVVWLLATDQLLNPVFVSTVTTGAFASLADLTMNVVGWVIAIICAAVITEGWVKALRRS